MCGFIYNVSDFPLLEPLFEIAGYDINDIRDIIRNKQLRPTDIVLNLVPSQNGPRILGATWWLATNTDGTPNTKLTTFNSRAYKLSTSPLHRTPPRSIRSIVLASGFCEWQPIFKGGLLYSQLPNLQNFNALPTIIKKQQFLIERNDSKLLLLGAVSKLRVDQQGNPKINTSIITLPPHDDFIDIHHKSFPLVLNLEDIESWLDPQIPLENFDYLIGQNTFRQDFRATHVNGNLFPLAPPIIFPKSN